MTHVPEWHSHSHRGTLPDENHLDEGELWYEVEVPPENIVIFIVECPEMPCGQYAMTVPACPICGFTPGGQLP